MIKKLMISACLFFLVLVNPISFAWADAADALLVLDMRNVPQLPKHFRSSTMLPHVNEKINIAGWEKLRMAGGAQFSERALVKIIEQLKLKHFTVIDLRQESHGFLNGNAVSWYGPQDAANANLTDEEIEEKQGKLLEALGHEKSAVVYQILNKAKLSGRIVKTKPVEFAVHSVSSERDLVRKHHLRYRRVYVQDFHAPNDKEVDRFIRIVNALPADEWIYFHCHAGIGRTTTFMAMLDIMRNAKTLSFDEILARQKALGGKELTAFPSKQAFKYPFAIERLAFLKAFYQYAKDNKDQFATTWREYHTNKTID